MAFELYLACLLALVLPFANCQDGESEIAFSAGLTHHVTLAASQKVVYDRLYTNVGSGYSTSTGIFTCPLGGLYVFNLHSLARSGSNMYLELYHNYHYVVSVWGHTDNDFAAAGNSVILQLTKGDQVYVSAGQDDVQLYGDPTEVYATFSGYLISPVFQEFPVVG